MMTKLMPVTAHDPAIARAATQAEAEGKPLPLNAGMSAKEIVHALLELAGRREIGETRVW